MFRPGKIAERKGTHYNSLTFTPRNAMLFQLDNVTKTYGPVTALDNLSVAAPTGAVGLLGPNGSGKTTMIRTLLGLITVDRGEGQILGYDIRRQQLDIRRSVGFAPEDECLFPNVAGIDFVGYAGELVGMSRGDAMQRAHEVLDYVGLSEARYRRVESYSTGMKQRLKLASAIVHDPKLLILDEPTNGMDPAGRDEVLELSRDLAHNKGMSVLFSSHLLPDVEAVCEHVMVMGAGRLLTQGKIQELKGLQQLLYDVRLKADTERYSARLSAAGCWVERRDGDLLVIKVPDGRDHQLLWETARAEGLQIRHLRPRRATLEDVFLRAVDYEPTV
jgi:ABC-2 type transport system ATP-binding protein